MIHATLKQITQTYHDSVEAKLRVLLSEKLSIDQYAAIQKKMYGFYRPVEEQLSSITDWDDTRFTLRDRLKLPLLIDDLAILSLGSNDLEQLPVCTSLPCLETVSEALGCLYVLEGSTLGGKIITKHLKNSLGWNENCKFAFFNSYGDNVGPMWSSFLQILVTHCEKCRDEDAVVRSACQTFLALDRWYSNVA